MTLLYSFSGNGLKRALDAEGLAIEMGGPADARLDTPSKGLGLGLAPKGSRPPSYAGLDAAALGFADFTTRDADALLVWFRTGGRAHRVTVELYLARRAIAADWSCTAEQAAHVIRDAMLHVTIPPGRRGAPTRGALTAAMRKRDFYRLRASAAAWLRAAIMDAAYRYGVAIG